MLLQGMLVLGTRLSGCGQGFLQHVCSHVSCACLWHQVAWDGHFALCCNTHSSLDDHTV
jgi:hypothetical protein